jgi:hypothetical protein
LYEGDEAVKKLLLVLPLVFACSEDHISGTFDLDFGNQVVCEAKVLPLTLTNDTGGEVVIGGASIAGGTDAQGNFSLKGVTVAGVETPSLAGSVSGVTVPPGENYIFSIEYSPKSSQGPHSALLDIAFEKPRGVYQFRLVGSPEGEAPQGCVSLSQGAAVSFDGPVTLTVTKLVAATSELDAPISSEDSEVPFQPATIQLELDLAGGRGTLKLIPEGSFILPKPRPDVPTLGPRIKQDSVVSTLADATGTYQPSNGILSFDDVQVKLNGDFDTVITVTLTTEPIDLKELDKMPNATALRSSFGTKHFDSVGKKIFGSRIDEEGNVTLVGTTKIESATLDAGTDSIFRAMTGTILALLIEGQITVSE